MQTAVVPENDFSTDADQEPSVANNMGRVEREAPDAPTPTSASHSMAFLAIAATDAALQCPSESEGVAAGLVVSREELTLDRAMGQTPPFALDSADASPIAAQDGAAARDDVAATAAPSATPRAAVAPEALAEKGGRTASPSWRQRAANGVAVMLFACDQLFLGRRHRKDDKGPSKNHSHR
jgi:hypothetical protein